MAGRDAGPALRTALAAALGTVLAPVALYGMVGVPVDAARPYVVLGSATAVADATKTSDGQEHTITIDIWTDGADAAGALLAQLRDALHDAESALTVAGQTVVLCRVDVQTLLPDPDTPGVTHGVLRLRVVTEPA